jgi:hypothetical protein
MHMMQCRGDKQTFVFGYNFTGTPYSMVPRNPFGVGLAQHHENHFYLSANTMGQRHPSTGKSVHMDD